MKPARAQGLVRWPLPFFTIGVIGSLPLTWVHVTSVGGFDLQLPYVLTILLGLLLCSFPKQFSLGLKGLPLAFAPWLITYGFYLVILALALAGGPSKGMVIRQVFFLTCGCTVALGIVATGADGRVLRRGGLLAIVGFFVLVELLARQIGLGWIIVIKHLLSTGDLEFVFYQFLKETFQLVTASGSEAKAADKNVVAVAILVALFLIRAGHTTTRADRFGKIVMLLGLFILVILNTRSVLLIAAISLPLAGWISTMRNGVNSSGEFILKSVFFFGIMIAVVLVLSTDFAVAPFIDDRFSFSDSSSNKRLQQYAWALERIEVNPLWGSGLAEFKGQPVHNLFLGAWMHAGFFAFFLVTIGYSIAVISWLAFVFKIVTRRDYWVLPVRVEWIAVLPILPLLRVWIAGDAGHPSFVEWTTLCLFLGVVHSNGLARTGMLAYSPTNIECRSRIPQSCL